MKHNVISVLCVFAFTSSVTASYKAVRGAVDHGATATFDLTVVNEKNEPLEDIAVEGWFWNNQRTKSYTKDTDELGHVVIKGKSGAYGGYRIKKDGYYKTYRKQMFVREGFDCAKETFWGYEWVPIYKETVVLKTIRNPIPMYACRLSNRHFKLPDFNQAFPFDLQKMDWCKPHGKGIRDDIYIEVKTDVNEYNYVYPVELILTFKHKDEGMYITQSDITSDFKSSYHANVNGIFKSKMIESPIKGRPSLFGVLDHYRVFRIRCEHDEKGEIISAHYGKIYGYWLQNWKNELGNVSIYFNPTPNDTNLEYDPEQNLYKGDTYEETLQSRVCAP